MDRAVACQHRLSRQLDFESGVHESCTNVGIQRKHMHLYAQVLRAFVTERPFKCRALACHAYWEKKRAVDTELDKLVADHTCPRFAQWKLQIFERQVHRVDNT
mmetsp:Transcript_2274/g.5014  ORF Transcript_2274/g.5014 Transcript_2274/m.5014 type:complete len:103 (+) Transcript_2274:163-471(+)